MREGANLKYARTLRREATFAETKLWEQLRRKSLGGHKFVRQEPIGPFIADFVCRRLKVIVEVDGATHSTEAEIASDRQRTRYLEQLGYRVVRVTNSEVIDGMDQVLNIIAESLQRGGE